MINIAICDDSAEELKNTKDMVALYFKAHGDVIVKVKTFSSSKDLLNETNSDIFYDIYILDIIMDSLTGVELAKIIKNKKETAKVVFTTTSKDYAIDAFSLNADHYLIKPYKKAAMFEALDRVVDAGQEEDYIVKNSGKGLKKMLVKNICYSESSGHYQYIHLSDGEIVKVRLKTNELWEDLGKFPQFIRPHGGYIVNMDYIKSITSFGLKIGDFELPISKNTLNKLKKTYMNYTFNKKKWYQQLEQSYSL